MLPTTCGCTGVLLWDSCSLDGAGVVVSLDGTDVFVSLEPSGCPSLTGVAAGSLELWASSLIAGTV
ncbi:MAG: hypothetical protein WBQ14_11475 [Gaiellaceae bacterium]